MNRIFHLFTGLGAILIGAGCVSVTRVSADAPLENSKAYVARYYDRESWRFLDFCTVTSVDSARKGTACERIKRGDEYISCVPPGRHRLFLEIRTSSKNVFLMPGIAHVSLPAELQGGTLYAVALRRITDARAEIWIYDRATGAVVSDKLSVEVSHPIYTPIPVPL